MHARSTPRCLHSAHPNRQTNALHEHVAAALSSAPLLPLATLPSFVSSPRPRLARPRHPSHGQNSLGGMSLLPADFIAYTYGANLVSTCLSCVSWEILVALGWQYFSRFPEDRWVYKGLAAFMLVAGTADTAISELSAISDNGGDSRKALTQPREHRRLPIYV